MGDVEEDDGLDLMTGFSGDGHDFVFFARPTADGREDEWVRLQIFALEIREDPFVKDVGGNESAAAGVVGADFGFFCTDDEAGGKEFGAEGFGEADALGVFAGHWQTENVDGASAEPFLDD